MWGKKQSKVYREEDQNTHVLTNCGLLDSGLTDLGRVDCIKYSGTFGVMRTFGTMKSYLVISVFSLYQGEPGKGLF